MTKQIMLLISISFLFSCKNESKVNTSSKRTINNKSEIRNNSNTIKLPDERVINYDVATTNLASAEKIKSFLLKELKNDIDIMKRDERKFSFYEIDLNNDGKYEYFVKPEGQYFCGTGGCTFYLLNNNFVINTTFTVTNSPIFKTSSKTNGWNDLILLGDYSENEGVKNYIHLKYDKIKGHYPSNPTLIKKSEVAPNGHDMVMWDDEFSVAKKFTF